MTKKKFLRRVWRRHSKLGKRRKKKQVWRKPKGRDNKMREKRKGYPAVVKIGYKKSGREENFFVVRNLKDLSKAKKISEKKTILLGKVGKKKKIEILKKAREEKIPIQNVNIKKFLRKTNKKKEQKK